MNSDPVLVAKPRPGLLDIFLVTIGTVMFAAGFYMAMGSGSPWLLVGGFVAGCVLGALAWWWPRIIGPVLLVLSIPPLAYTILLTLYTHGLPNLLVALWGCVAFLVGGIGISRWRSAARQPKRHNAIQAGWVGSLAAVFLLYVAIMWPPQAKQVLIELPILEPPATPQVQPAAGGGWVAYWTIPRVTVPEALESAKTLLESDGWTIIDTAVYPRGIPMISAQRGAYSLYVIYDPEPSYTSDGQEIPGYIEAFVRRSQAGQIPEPDINR